MLPRGLDGLFLPPVAGVEVLALVPRGSPEEAWARALYPADHVLPYAWRRDDLGPYPATADVLERSDIAAVMRASHVEALLLSASCAPMTLAWSQRHDVRLLMTDHEHQRRFEDKIAFDTFLKRHDLPRPTGGPVTLGRDPLPVRGPAVVQVPDSMGGEGTFFVRGPEDVDALTRRGALHAGRRYLVRERIQGAPYGVTIFVAPGLVALSALRLQCYHPDDGGAEPRAFAGVQWVPSSALGRALRLRVDQTFLALGELLYRRRFFGFANVDFMIDGRGRLFIIECNPRMSAATPQLLHLPELLSGVSAGAAFLQGFLGGRGYPHEHARLPLPTTSYRGATLDVVYAPGREGVVTREHASGLYALGADPPSYLGPDVRRLAGSGELAVISFARAGQPCRQGDTLATLLSTDPLYDDRGEMLAPARRALTHFRHTDAEAPRT
jgi:hypothetical protein